MRRLLACLVVLCAVAGLALADDKAAAFTFTTIDPPGSVFTFPFGINDQGDVIGNYTTSDGVDHGFLLQQGAFTTIDPPGSIFTFATGINPEWKSKKIIIVGIYDDTSGFVHGFVANVAE